MPIVSMKDLLERARSGGYAIGYFEAWDQYSMEASLEAAEQAAAPAIIGFGGAVVDQGWLDRGGLEQWAVLACTLAHRSALPVAVLCNEVNTFAHVLRALRAGCNAVMLDTSAFAFARNAELTAKVVEAAHAVGATVEAEIGHLPDASTLGSAQPDLGMRTDPDEAGRFVELTGVDALAVSVGNTHNLAAGESAVDMELVARLRDAAGVPLVIHGGTGFPAWAVREVIARGVAKFNVGTRLKQAYLDALRAALAVPVQVASVHDIVGSRSGTDPLLAARQAVADQIAPLIALYGAAGKAADWARGN
ncbi:MAG: class II fructose-bisphosphate aldolase [Chloroflexi bacterium]|nr:class II fructose-bisphosphate aldolase [Chloroflexota bacterium]